MCVHQPLTLYSFHSKLIWLLTRLDGKGLGARSAHYINRWESPLCCHHMVFLLTGHAQRATPHTHTHNPPSSQGLFEPASQMWQWLHVCALSLFSHLTFTDRHGDSRGGTEEGCFLFLKALWVAGLICHSLFPLCFCPVTALWEACNNPVPCTHS